ncbi:3-hydroxyacyl-CoA dehydrogenase family protein [Microbacterium sp. zg.Y1090]|uniref:3-hydroxyacyl-CoA dehydrogenase family protein n=1 Tax=Microbacterium TaxID=33882 RepID=UPI00214C875E|nr:MULTISPECIES: 3-hydroxyacyl-CoA dehydrogenase family protein [unclassified Microbacterium]MCR2813782.1 3-hydroxyacyl-CoA dehydrogenase family protein [Microbacterium sp. zg.Y1084]MCR2819704.1 3-hydroxyacyl-CoA dehydrogenase family protein [Microbacterium sp. zg.Y1090]MDL5487552.1 3-hydroxyacyl-CoA dehydrogenase family protein [Microbacterium sp. zg-Y1211]WIM28052.1 3-hydroxyacyl-CoA dehydrogenase family protein [Microbacterium sp. zg-Y1090]
MTETTRPVYAVIGSGYMGGGIAQVLALSGADVRIADVDLAIAEGNRERLIAEAEQFAADGLFPADAPAIIAARVTATTIEQAVSGATFIEEAVPEKIEIKHATLRRISEAAAPDAIIGSNTSTILIGKLAEAVVNPERFLGVHFSNPAPFIPGVELIPHAATDPAIIPVVEQIVAATGKQTARVKDATGFVLNRLQYALFHEATQLVEEGVATPEDIDTIVRTTFGFRLPFFGPFAVADMAGLDVYAFCYASLQTEFPERFATPKILEDLVTAGKLGTKSGAGFLDVPAERTPELIAYRNKAYVAMQKLLDELGPAPIQPAAAGES